MENDSEPTAPERLETYSNSLRQLCQTRRSASSVAREIGINRQQFQKYLTGSVLPSANLRLRIATYFELPPEIFFDPPSFADRLDRRSPTHKAGQLSFEISPGAHEITRLREYAGLYHVHFVTPAFPELVHVGVSVFREVRGVIQSVFFVRSRNPETGLIHRSHLVGSVSLRGERLFVMERSKKAQDRFSETILFPTHGDRMKYLTGISLGLTWHPSSRPYASRTIWRRARGSLTLRDAIRGCGLYPLRSPAIDSQVRSFLSEADQLKANTLTV